MIEQFQQKKRVIIIDPVAEGIHNRVAEGTVCKGDFEYGSGLWVDGKIVGNLVVNGVLVLAPTGEIEGKVHVLGKRAVLAGRIRAREGVPTFVVVDGLAELAETLDAQGHLTAHAIDFHNGAIFDGSVRTVAASAAGSPAESQDVPAPPELAEAV